MINSCIAEQAENFDEIEEIKISSTMSEQEAKEISGSYVNDNGESGFPTPPASKENVTDVEFSEDNVVNECNNLNTHVVMHSSKEKPKSVDLTIIPENYRSIIIPEDPQELSDFVANGQIFIKTAAKLKNKKNDKGVCSSFICVLISKVMKGW